MEENGSDIVEMAVKGEQATSCLIRPDLDLVVVATRDEEGLCLVEVNTTNWSIMFFESIDQCSHTIVPELNGGRVKRHENPWSKKGGHIQLAGRRDSRLQDGELQKRIPFGMKGNAFRS